MSERLKIAITKGRLLDKSVELFTAMGLDCTPIEHPGRRLVHAIPNYPLEAVLAKAPDVITYVEHGVCDLGIVGKDILAESGADVYELLDLKMGKCRMCVAGPEDFYDDPNKTLRVATKFPHIAGDYYESRSRDIDIIKLNGSIELAPILGLSDVIVDIVETGNTLRENHLAPLETIVDISARFICNKVSYKFKYQEILAMRDALAKNL